MRAATSTPCWPRPARRSPRTARTRRWRTSRATANVGIGTLYRNFPTRQDLLEAVYAGEVQELCLGAQAVSELEPWDAFTTWLDSFARYVPTKLALLQALNKDSEVFRACKSAMLASALPIFQRAQQAGALRGPTSSSTTCCAWSPGWSARPTPTTRSAGAC